MTKLEKIYLIEKLMKNGKFECARVCCHDWGIKEKLYFKILKKYKYSK